MHKLKKVFNDLNNTTYCRYSTDRSYPTKINGKTVLLTPLELLEVVHDNPREHVMIAYFDKEPTRILYFGEDVNSMKKSLEDLKLPNSWPSNLGEKIFYRFRDHLDNIDSGPVSLEDKVVPGKEHQFELILRRLIEIYQTLDESHYNGENATSLGGVAN